jgi:prepilin-type N-terminal cleavage/methylation domain-containing protein
MGEACAPLARTPRGHGLLEVLVALAVLSVAIAGCAQALLSAVAAQSQAGVHEQAAWKLADANELVQAWPAGAPAAAVAVWRDEALAIAPAVTLAALTDTGSPAHRWQAALGGGDGQGPTVVDGFAALLHAQAPAP